MSIAERFMKRAQEEQVFYPGDIVKVEGGRYVKSVPYIVMKSYFSKAENSWINVQPINSPSVYEQSTIYLNTETPVLIEKSKWVAPPRFMVGQEVQFSSFEFPDMTFLGYVDGFVNEANNWINGKLLGQLQWNYGIMPISQLPLYPKKMMIWIPEKNIQPASPDDRTEMVMAQTINVLYHLTSSLRLKDIKKSGLRVEYAGDWSGQLAIYLADSVAQAASYVGREPEGNDAILAIDMSKLDLDYLVMDDDAIQRLKEEDKRYNPKDWKKSLRISHQVAYLKNIPASAITVLHEGIDENWNIPEER